jgi:glycosyltransferase involved in cell wall biosynthesis
LWREVELASRGGLSTPPDCLLDQWQACIDHGPTASGALDVAWRVADTLRRKGYATTALQVTQRAVPREVREPEQLLLAGSAAVCELDLSGPSGELSRDLAGLVRDLIAAADAELAGAGDELRVAELAGLALEVMFHRSRHTDVELSPLADPHDPLLAPWHGSALRRHLDGGAGQRSTIPVAAGQSVLLVTWESSSFLPRLAQDLSAAGATVRSLVLKDTSWPRVGPVRNLVWTRLARLAGRKATVSPPESVLAAVAAADTVVVDWCNHVAVWLPGILRDGQRLVIRLHSVEALSADAQLVPWHRVDQLIVVSEPLRRLVAAVVPQTEKIRVSVVPPIALTMDSSGQPKKFEAWRTLGLVGWGRTVKDAQFALDVLKSLRSIDPSWRLLLVGEEPAPSATPYAATYSAELIRRARSLESEKALERLGYVEDMAKVLSRIGFILSTSTRESFHAAVVEGAASGAVPVVRNWPLLKEYGGAGDVLHPDWVVNSVEQARDRILAHENPTSATEAGQSAREYARSQFGPDRVARTTVSAVLGDGWTITSSISATSAGGPADARGDLGAWRTARGVRRIGAVARNPRRLTASVRRRTRVAAKVTVHRLGTEALLEHPMGALLWRCAVQAPGIPAADRISTARKLAHRLASHGRESAAADLLEAASRHLSTPDRARLKTESALILLEHDLDTPARLRASVEASLAAADNAWRARAVVPTAQHLADAFTVAFHRVLHFDRSTSPLAGDPEGYLAPLRESSAFAHASRAGRRSQPATEQPTHRLLVASYLNFNFTTPIIARYQGLDDVEVRRLDVGRITPGQLPESVRQVARTRLLTPLELAEMPHEEHIERDLRWADVAFVDWSQRAAVLITALDPGSTRVVVRLHSYEAFTCFPHLVDWSRVDDVVFVGRHLQQLVSRIVPDLPARQHVLPVLMDLARMKRDKGPEARTTLAVLGWSAPAKDAIWAIEVLAELLREDPSYRLLLVGAGAGASAPTTVATYVAGVQERAARQDVAANVDFVAHTDDVPSLLERVGTILSSSVRESFHAAVAEGAASGAVPVVRDWPMFVPYGGAGAVYPQDWIVHVPSDAARRILRTTRDEVTWRAEGKRAQEQALSTFDQSVIGPLYDDLLGIQRTGTP